MKRKIIKIQIIYRH